MESNDLLNQLIMLASYGVGVVLALILGVLLGRSGIRRLRDQSERVRADLARVTTHSREQERVVARLKSEQDKEQRPFLNLARSLPYVVGELNRLDLDPRRIPELMIQLAEAIFEPRQALVYIVATPVEAGSDSPPELQLKAHRGVEEVPASLRRLKVGEGKIGWVAANKVEMLADDWQNLTRTGGHALEDNHPAVQLDMIAPMVQHEGKKHQIIGVLCVGRPGLRPPNEKLMLQVITNLASLAFTNTQNRRKLMDQAHHDGLTGLLNKSRFLQEFGELIYASQKSGGRLGAFVFDIDHFKNYNDTNGHQAGDETLKLVASLLRRSIRPGDLAGRYGGEEFIVAMPDTDPAEAFRVAERIRETIASHEFPHGHNQPLGVVSISGGVASYPIDGTDTGELIRHADEALYQSKSSGRNKITRYRGVVIGEMEGDDPNLGEAHAAGE